MTEQPTGQPVHESAQELMLKLVSQKIISMDDMVTIMQEQKINEEIIQKQSELITKLENEIYDLKEIIDTHVKNNQIVK